MSESELDNLELTAFRFVAGEMSPDEAAAFEDQLAADQQTREAVCQAVALTAKLTLVGLSANGGEHDSSASDSRQPTVFTRVARSLSWMAIGALAASLVFLVAGTPETEPDDSLTQQSVADDLELPRPAPSLLDPNLVDTLAWMEMRDATRWNLDMDWPDGTFQVRQPLPELDAPTTIPDWILQTDGDNE